MVFQNVHKKKFFFERLLVNKWMLNLELVFVKFQSLTISLFFFPLVSTERCIQERFELLCCKPSQCATHNNSNYLKDYGRQNSWTFFAKILDTKLSQNTKINAATVDEFCKVTAVPRVMQKKKWFANCISIFKIFISGKHTKFVSNCFGEPRKVFCSEQVLMS